MQVMQVRPFWTFFDNTSILLRICCIHYHFLVGQSTDHLMSLSAAHAHLMRSELSNDCINIAQLLQE